MLNAFIPCVPKMHPFFFFLKKQNPKNQTCLFQQGTAHTTCGAVPFVFFLETGIPSPQGNG